MNGSDDLGDRAEQLRRIELSKRRCALDQGNLGPPHRREIELGLRGLSRALEDNGIIEHMYVHDISSIVWEILRLRRCKVVIINSGFRSALQNLLKQVLRQPGQSRYDVEHDAQALALAWFTDQEAKKQVSEILSQFKLDEFAIEAQAIRSSSADLELLDRLLTSLESRRDKALGCVAEYRASLAHQLRESADRFVDGKGLHRLEDAASKRSTAA